jgi:hypothetical protein
VESETVIKTLELWHTGQATKAGWLLYSQIPIADRPHWAAQILDLCRSVVRSPPEVSAVYDMAVKPSEWGRGHDAFGAVRKLTLQYEKAEGKDGIYGGLLHLAENVAKVTYNATSPQDPFDCDAGAWVVSCLRNLVDKIGSRDFESRAWSLASRQATETI